MTTVVSGALGWFLSCPTVLESVFVYATLLGLLFSVIGYARGR